MTTFSFAPATRVQARARIGLQGPAGCGKTKSALRIGEGLAQGGPIGLVDTERGSALKYAPVPGRPDLGGHVFQHLPLSFCSPENLIAIVRAAEEARLAVLIIDSWSHFWAGKGGLLARVDEESKKPGHYGGSYTAWAPVNDLEQQMLDALLGFPGHVIVTMRTKNDYEMTGGQVKKVGVKTIQREGAEYELDVVIDMVQGTGTVTKTRYSPLDSYSVLHPGEELGEEILEQLGAGVDPAEAFLEELRAGGLTYEGALEIYGRADRRGLLGVPAAHPATGEVMPLGDAIRAVGTALKAAATEPSSSPTTSAPARQDEDEHPDEQQPAERPAPAQGSAVTAPMMRRIFAQLKAVGCPEDRDERLRVVGLLLGKPVGSMNELAFGDGSELIETLAAFEGDGGRERFAETLLKLRAAAA